MKAPRTSSPSRNPAPPRPTAPVARLPSPPPPFPRRTRRRREPGSRSLRLRRTPRRNRLLIPARTLLPNRPARFPPGPYAGAGPRFQSVHPHASSVRAGPGHPLRSGPRSAPRGRPGRPAPAGPRRRPQGALAAGHPASPDPGDLLPAGLVHAQATGALAGHAPAQPDGASPRPPGPRGTARTQVSGSSEQPPAGVPHLPGQVAAPKVGRRRRRLFADPRRARPSRDLRSRGGAARSAGRGTAAGPPETPLNSAPTDRYRHRLPLQPLVPRSRREPPRDPGAGLLAIIPHQGTPHRA